MQQTQTFQFSLTQDEANLVLNALGELPFKVAQGLINNMIKQYADQNNKQQELALAE